MVEDPDTCSLGDEQTDDERRVERELERRRVHRPATSYHEAGHIVAAHLLGYKVVDHDGATLERISVLGLASTGLLIQPGDLDEAEAGTLTGLGFGYEARCRIENEIVMLAAGPFAAARALDEGLVSEPQPEPTPSDPLERHLAEREADVTRDALSAAARAAGEELYGPSDTEQVERLLRSLAATEHGRRGLRVWLEERAFVLVHSAAFWQPCRALAEALLAAGTLTGAQCLQIITEGAPDAPEGE